MWSNQCGMRSAEWQGRFDRRPEPPMRRTRGPFRIPHSRHLIHFGLEGLKAALAVIGQRVGMIERAGMEPHARGPECPGVAHRAGEEMLAKALADRAREQAEICDL